MGREYHSLSVKRIASVEICAEATAQAGLDGGSFPVHLCWRYDPTPETMFSKSTAFYKWPWCFLAPVPSLCRASSWSGSSKLYGKQDCCTSYTQGKPHTAAPPKAHTEPGDFTVE